MQKIVFWVIGLVIIVGGWYLYSSQGSSQAVPENSGAAQTAGDATEGAGSVTAAQPVPGENTANVPEMVVANVPATVITFTEAGFVPSAVTIKKGQTVRWMNNSGTNVWPASAVHPSHEVYPQKSPSDCLGSSFDACRGLVKGESWDFQFDYVGEWKFHDHMNTANRGSVTVTE